MAIGRRSGYVLLTMSEAAEVLGISVPFAYNLAKAGKLPGAIPGDRNHAWFVHVDTLRKELAKQASNWRNFGQVESK
jgi:excisionase family DNA binding protein